ncbi:MAG TPA: hypothetical protein VFS32_11100 [Candidatus Limnocylindrales bacterium]|nr:hypothetical protein [Candidatus Limnocylindrales bacterium]
MKAIGCIAPAPSPWIVRKAMSWAIEPLSPQSADPPTNKARPNRKIGFRPTMSASLA